LQRRWLAAIGISLGLALVSLAAAWSPGLWIGLLAAAALLAGHAARLRTDTVARENWQQALDAMQAGIVLYDAEDRLITANADFKRLYGLTDAQLWPGLPFEDLLRERVAAGQVPEALGCEEDWIAARVAQRRSGDGGTMLRRMADGRWRRIVEQRLPDGGMLGFSIDVTELVEQERALDAARAQLHDAIEALPEGFALYDADDRFVLCNQRYRDLYRESAPALVPGARFESVLRYGLERGQYPQAAADPEAWLAERLRRHQETDGQPILQQLPGERWLRIDERRTASGGVAGVRTDVTEMVRVQQALREANEALEALSATDPLTGLANRRAFDRRLADEVARARRQGTPLALLLADIDHFKRYNDRHGHPRGDAALRAVADVLARQARRGGELVARYGGEEFALLVPGVDPDAGLQLAERCVAAVAACALPHGDSPTAAHLTLSVGCAVFAGGSAEFLVQRADQALYAAKAAGRARAVGAQPPIA
jgi:diguanylate cyclase (GGDEF)-like protein